MIDSLANDEKSIRGDRYFSRRVFFKIAGVSLAVLAAPLSFPVDCLSSSAVILRRGGKRVMFRSGAGGKLLESLDSGRTWQVNNDFGDACTIRNVYCSSGKLMAEIEHQGFSFTLHSVDGLHWKC
jgi:hypothetical protein